MKITGHPKIERLASDDATRANLSEPYLLRPDAERPTRGLLCATNGHALIAHVVELHTAETEGHVAGTVLADARKAAGAKAPTHDVVVTPGEAAYEHPTHGTLECVRSRADGAFPDVSQVMPDVTPGELRWVAVNVALLRRTLDALDTDAIVFAVADADQAPGTVAQAPIIVHQACNPNAAIAIIMPLRADAPTVSGSDWYRGKLPQGVSIRRTEPSESTDD